MLLQLKLLYNNYTRTPGQCATGYPVAVAALRFLLFFIRFPHFFFNCFFRDESNDDISKLYLLRCRVWFLTPFLLRGLTWATFCAWTQNHPKIVGTCPGLLLQLISQNHIFQIIGLKSEPPKIFVDYECLILCYTLYVLLGLS